MRQFQPTLDVAQISEEDPQVIQESSSFGQLLKAHVETNISQSLYGFTKSDIQYGTEFDPNFELTEDDFVGYEDFVGVLKNSINRDQLDSYKSEIDDLRLNEKIKAEHGGISNLVAGLATAPLDTTAMAIAPILGLSSASVNIFKTFGLNRFAAKVIGEKALQGAGIKALKSAIGGAAVGGAFGATATASKSFVGADVGAEDLAIGFAEGAVLGALFSGTVEGLGSIRKNRIRSATKNYYDKMEIPLSDKPLPEEHSFINKSELTNDILANKKKITDVADSAFGAEMVRSDPGTRLDTSAFSEARSIRAQLSDTNISYVDAAGKTIENIPSVESTVKLNFHEDMNAAYDVIDKGFEQYQKGDFLSKTKKFITGRNAEYNHFTSEIGKAVRNGGVHQDPAVQNAAKIFIEKQNKLTQKALDLGMYGDKKVIEDFSREGLDPGYLHSMYDREKIQAREGDFKQALMNGFMESQGLNAESAEIAATAAIDSILGEGSTRFTSNVIERGPFKNKTLIIPAKYLDEFMINNIDIVYEKFSRTMNTDIRLMELYGTTDVAKVIEPLEKEFAAITKTAKTNQDKAFLRSDFEQAKRDISTIWNRLRGTTSVDAASFTRSEQVFRSATNTLMSVTGARLLGSMLLTATNDIGQAAITIGAKRFLGSAVKLMTNPKAFNGLKKDNPWMRALKVVEGTRMTTLADTASTGGFWGMAERSSREISNSLYRMTGIHAWDGQSKLIAGYATSEKMLDIIKRAVRKERVSRSDTRFMKQLGVSNKMYQSIYDNFEKHGNIDKHGIVSPRIQNWEKDARTAFGSAIKKVQDQAVITPGVADIPTVFDNKFFAPFLQFKRFAFAAYQKSLVPALQKRDFNTMSGMMMILSTGMFKAAINAGISGKTLDPDTAMERAVEQSDVLSFLPDLYGAASGLFGFNKANNYAQAQLDETLLGPSWGTLKEFSKTRPFQLIQGNTTKAQIRAIRRLIPFQNHLILKRLFNEASESIESKFPKSIK